MKNIKNLKPKRTIVFENDKEKLVLVEDETIVELVTDGSEHDRNYSGTIIFINEDGIELAGQHFIYWDYIEEVNII